MKNLLKFFGWVLFILPFIIFYLFEWFYAILSINLLLAYFSYILYNAGFFKPQFGLVKIILPPLLFGFIGVIYMILKGYQRQGDANDSKDLPPFVFDYNHALKGINGGFDFEADLHNKYELKPISREENIESLLMLLQQGKVEFFELTKITCTGGRFKFKYDATILNNHDSWKEDCSNGLPWNYEEAALFKLSDKYILDLFHDMVKAGVKNYEDFVEKFYEEYSENEYMWALNIESYSDGRNEIDIDSHSIVFELPAYYQTYNPDGMFPIDVIETGFQEHIDIELYYRLKDL